MPFRFSLFSQRARSFRKQPASFFVTARSRTLILGLLHLPEPFLFPFSPAPTFFFSLLLSTSLPPHGLRLSYRQPPHLTHIRLDLLPGSSSRTSVEMATTAMDYEAANGDRYEGSLPSLRRVAATRPHHTTVACPSCITATHRPSFRSFLTSHRSTSFAMTHK